jgi:spore photoproduct lyase
LQSYFHPPALQYFVNHTDLLVELERYFHNGEISRIGTGEFTDSLIWEKWTDLSKILIQKFAEQQKCVLELKSKSVSIDALRYLDHQKKTIVSWSLNTQSIIKTEERRTAPLSARLKAAQKCESWGYPIGFHFDPIIIYDHWEQDYEKVIQQIFKYVSPRSIVWISLGTFRYPPALKPIIQKRFPDSKIVYGEFIPGLDGKMRYFKPLRVRAYEKIVAWIRKIAPQVTIYFCMESNDVWQRVMGYVPGQRGGLERILDESAVEHCKLKS